MATVCNSGFNSCDYLNDYDIYNDTILFFEEPLGDQWSDNVSSIQEDVAKIAANRSRSMSSSYLDDNNDIDTKPEIRFGDCMWSTFGTTPAGSIGIMGISNNGNSSGTGNNTSKNININNSSNNNNNINSSGSSSNINSAASSYSESSAVPPAIVSGNTLMIKSEIEDEDEDDTDNEQQQEEDDELEAEAENAENCNRNSNNNSNNKSCSGNKLATIATLQRITITKANKSSMHFTSNNKKNSSNNNNAEEHIPPGTSLLRKSITALNNNNNNNNNIINKRFNKSLVTPKPSSNHFVRPETPQSSTYEDANLPVLEHNVDLRACIVGSNNIALTNNADANFIDHISRELQNTSKNRIDMLPYVPLDQQPQINDVLDVISQLTTIATTIDDDLLSTLTTAPATAASTTATTTIPVVATSLSPPASNSDCDSDDGNCSMVDSSCGSSASVDGNNSIYMRHISDHSYTRSEMETNLETPSDSDEEIDVVSLNDKKLPTNPSDRDRRALQTKVANKISTLPPPRRGRYELPYTPASSSPVKSEANSRFPSPSSTPYLGSGAMSTIYSPFVSRNSNSLSSNSSSAGSDCTTPSSSLPWEGKSRKRYYVNDSQYRVYSSIKGNKPSSHSSAAGAKKSRVKKVNTNGLISGGFPAYPMSQVKQQQQQQQQPTLGASNSNSSSNNNNNNSSSSSSSSSNNSNNNSNNNSMLKRHFSLDEADTIEKRNLHNDMERQRRIGLKNLFEALKKQIPNIRDKERAPKVNILREAAKLCEQLTSEERELNLKRQLLKAKLKQQQELIARLRLSKNATE